MQGRCRGRCHTPQVVVGQHGRVRAIDGARMYDVECKKHVRLPHALATLTGLRSLGMTNIRNLEGWSALKSKLPCPTVCDVTGTTFV